MKKHHLNPVLFLPIIFFLACNGSEDLKEASTGKVIFNVKDAPRETIKLTNARTSSIVIDSDPVLEEKYQLEIRQGDEVVLTLDDLEYGEEGTLELEVGQYTAYMQNIVTRENYGTYVAAEGSKDFTVTAGQTQNVHILMYSNTIFIWINLRDLPDAKVWIGEKGFEPSDADLYPVHGTGTSIHIGDNDEFEIVVEFEGERKRYSVDATRSNDYVITIRKKEEEEPEEKEQVIFTFEHASEETFFVDLEF